MENLRKDLTMNNRFLIGQFETFDKQKQEREFREGFKGIELCQFANTQDIDEIFEFSRIRGLDIGVHFPLRKGHWTYRDPQYLSLDAQTKSESYAYMADEFAYIASKGAEYVLLHYPKPVILDRKVDWDRCWRFADATEYYYEDDYTYETFKEKSKDFFKWLNEEAKKYQIKVYLELDAVNGYLYETNLLSELLDEFDQIRLCLDIGRLHLQNKIDDSFDPFDFIGKFGKYVDHVHLWNVKVTNNVEGGHHPMLPSLKPQEGWADVEAYFKALNQNCGDYTILFEHYAGNISDQELQACYNWINQLV